MSVQIPHMYLCQHEKQRSNIKTMDLNGIFFFQLQFVVMYFITIILFKTFENVEFINTSVFGTPNTKKNKKSILGLTAF